MAEPKGRKAETKSPRKRSSAVAKGAKASKARVKASVDEKPVAEIPVEEVSTAEVSQVEKPVAEEPAVEALAAKDVSKDEIRKAAKLLWANGYLLIPYGKIGKGIAWFFGAVAGLVSGACRGLCGWFSKKRTAMKVRREENRRVSAEKKRQADEAARRAEIEKTEMRLAELRAAEARLKAAAATVEQPAPDPIPQSTIEPVGRPATVEPVNPSESEPIVQPQSEKDNAPEVKEPEVNEPDVVVPAVSGVPKCAACGAELVPGARFCRECGTRINV